MMENIPNPIAPDAPTPEETESDTIEPYGPYIAYDHDGARYCPECTSVEYANVCKTNERKIPYGGPVLKGSEIDCPGATCDHCLRRIKGFTVLHYDGVCGEYCTQE